MTKSRRNCVVAFGVLVLVLSGSVASADDGITVTIDSLTNVSGNGALEACGDAVSKDGAKPLIVTVKHDESYYTTLTAANNKWCVVFKRWTFNGAIEAGATTLQKAGQLELKRYSVGLSE